jgi:undecaprenyl diphosphate synthase
MAKKTTEPDKQTLPKHIGFIMDGNGRWAKKRGLPRKFGHSQGAKAFKEIVRHCKSIGVPVISFYVFSTENWTRPADEVEAIMQLLREYLDDVRSHIGEEVKVLFLGDKSLFAEDIRRKMLKLEEDSKDFTKMTLLLAVNYGGRDDILNACKKITKKVVLGELKPDDISEHTISENLYTAELPDIDFLIRTSGEMRISNYLLWQSAYAEFYFTETLWPDFSPKELNKAIADFAQRHRRFGGTQ